MKIYEALALAFAAEGVDTHFTLIGDGNMHWALAMEQKADVQTIHARHEHCAVAMAAGYASASGDVGVASVTCGPGFTQLMTALASAARDNMPLVVLAGESPLEARWHIQQIDQRSLAVAAGAEYVAVHSPRLVHHLTQKAFILAKQLRKPVVLGLPYDLQKQDMPDIEPYVPSSNILPKLAPIQPDSREIEELVAKIEKAAYPLILGGRGMIAANGEKEVERLADACGALLGTTLLARGAFDHNPFSLGVIGGFGRAVAQEYAQKADLVVAFGASLSYFTQHGGTMFANAEVVQVDTKPTGLHQGVKGADSYIRADAKLAADALVEAMGKKSRTQKGVRSNEFAQRIRETPADDTIYASEPGTLDPREVCNILEGIVPRDFDVISGSGQQAYFHTVMRGYDPRKYHCMRGFGAIGSALCHAIGVAVARGNDGRVVLFEGDGSLLMNIQEFECIQRHKLKILVVVANDGAYGSEIQQLRREGLDDSITLFGRPNFETIATGFGLRGAIVKDLHDFPALMKDYEQAESTTVWDIHTNDLVANPIAKILR